MIYIVGMLAAVVAAWLLWRRTAAFIKKLHAKAAALESAVLRLLELKTEENRCILLREPKYEDPKRLSRYEATVSSQSGEDGILAETFRRIGTTNKVFAEFGCGDGSENNTGYLLNCGWSGLWIEGDRGAAERAARDFARPIGDGRLKLYREFVTAENIAGLFLRAGLPAEPDLLSIDIDGNDYWIWEALYACRARVVVMEYNAIFPPGIDWVMDYDAEARWDGSSHFGASLSAFERLGNKKGYSLVGCNLAGVNAFFVRQDLVSNRFTEPFTTQNHYEPPRYFLGRSKAGHPRRPSSFA